MGRHRQPARAGLPPVLSGAAVVAAAVCLVVLVQPAAVPVAALVLPAPTVAARTSAPAPTTTAAPTTTVVPLTAPRIVTPAPTTTKPKSTGAPKATSKAPAPTATPVPAGAPPNPKCEHLGVAAQVHLACLVITAAVPGITVIGGVGSRPGNPTSCHPKGLALDLMVYKDKALGDRIAAFVRAHKAELGLTTILWQVPDHYDHVHISVLPCVH